MQLGPAALYKHNHPPIEDMSEVELRKLTAGQRIADGLAAVVGSWPFIIVQSLILVSWMAFNTWLAFHPGAIHAWDPYPFILLNLVLSFQAAYTGPIVMMSQNRQTERDRLDAKNDYLCNLKAEEEIRVLMEHLAHQDEILAAILARVGGSSSEGVGDTPEAPAQPE